MTHVAIATEPRVRSILAQDHAHIFADPGFDPETWAKVCSFTIGDGYGDLPNFFAIDESGVEEWIFYFDTNMTPPRDRTCDHS